MQPYEIILSPADVFIAFEGTPFPAIDAVPSGDWPTLGMAGKRSQAEGGVKIKLGQTVKMHSTVGSMGPVKGVRTAEEASVEVTIEDLTLETFSKALNLAGVTEVAAASAVAGSKSMGLSQGGDLQTFALLVRFPSAYGDGMNSQYQFPRVANTGSVDQTFDSQGTAAALAFVFAIMEDPNAANEKERFGKLVEQTAPALP